jgi:hypothetical protein
VGEVASISRVSLKKSAGSEVITQCKHMELTTWVASTSTHTYLRSVTFTQKHF